MAHVAKYKAPALGHMFAHWDRVGSVKERENIDKSASQNNYSIGPQRHVMDVMAKRDSVTHQKGARKVRSDAVLVCDWVFTAPPDLRPEDELLFFHVCHSYAASLYGESNMLGGRVHVDEPGARHHMHDPFMPVVRDSKGVMHFDAKSVLSRAHLRAFHKGLQRTVDDALGYHVSVTLDEAQKGKKQLNHLSHSEYKAATAELRQVDEQLEVATLERDRITGEAADAEQNRAKLTATVAHLTGTVGQLEEKRDALGGEVEDLERQQREQSDAVRQLTATVAHLMDEEANAREKIIEARARRQEIEAANYLAKNAMPKGVTHQGLESVFAYVARQVADIVVSFWEDARQWAHNRWSKWDDIEKQQVADLLAIDSETAQTLSDGALIESADSIDRRDIADEILFGGDDITKAWHR